MSDQPAEGVHPTTFRRVWAGIGDSFALVAAMELDLFTPLRNGPLSAGQVANAVGGDAGKLELLLYVLVSLGLLTVEDGRFANSPEAQRFLVRGEPDYMGGQHRVWTEILSALSRTAESIRTGRAQGKIDFASLPSDRLANIIRGMYFGAHPAGRALAAKHDFSAHQTLLDAGGGSGGLAIALAQAHPHLAATVVDLPNVTPITRQIVAEAGLDGRVRVESVDLVVSPLVGSYDVAILRNVVQVLGPEEAPRALAHVARAVRPGGEVYVIGTVLEDSRLAPAEAVMDNLIYLNVYDGGQAYTESQYRGWLSDAGCEDVRVFWNELAGSAVLRARRQV